MILGIECLDAGKQTQFLLIVIAFGTVMPVVYAYVLGLLVVWGRERTKYENRNHARRKES